jgi:TetR/AcrR family transcriptional regulator, ethionamide resistance regulator
MMAAMTDAAATSTEQAILDAGEELLAEGPLHDISVERIIERAAISRATYYFYFSSKFGIVTRLLERTFDEMYEVVQPFLERDQGEPPEVALRRSLQAACDLWSRHRPLMRAVGEHWHAVPELQEMWMQGVVERFTDALSQQIDRERKAGLAPKGIDSHRLAATLLWATERTLYVAGLDVDDDLPDEQSTVEPLVAIWIGAIYGRGAELVKPKRSRSR